MRIASVPAVLTFLACGTDPVASVGGYTMEVVTPPAEIAVPGQRFDTVAVRLRLPDGTPAAFEPVNWGGYGSVTPFEEFTDGAGIARASWTLPGTTVVGQHRTGPSGPFTLSAASPRGGRVEMATTARAFTVGQLDASSGYACGIRSAELWCWGHSPYPLNWSLGVTVPRRITLPGGFSPVEVSTSSQMVCVRSADGPVFCATREYSGALSLVGALPSVTELVSAGDFFCGRIVNRTVRCWDRVGPTALLATEKLPIASIALAAGDGFACAVIFTGETWCWGRNEYGQLGNGLRTNRDAPGQVLTSQRFVDIVARGSGVCGITATQEVWCWGTAGSANGTVLPTRVELPWVRGPAVTLGSAGEGYVFNGGRLQAWRWEQAITLPPSFDGLTVIDVAASSQMCVRTFTDETHCSWILLHGGGDTSPYPSELVPVPDPASRP